MRAPMLAPEQEVELIARAQAGDQDAAAYILHTHLRIAARTAMRYARQGGNLSDLLQEVKIGLLIALEKFEPERGWRFATYSSWYVRQRVNDFVYTDSQTAVRFPTTRTLKQFFFNRARYAALLETAPTRDDAIAEIAKDLSVTPAKVEDILLHF